MTAQWNSQYLSRDMFIKEQWKVKSLKNYYFLFYFCGFLKIYNSKTYLHHTYSHCFYVLLCCIILATYMYGKQIKSNFRN